MKNFCTLIRKAVSISASRNSAFLVRSLFLALFCLIMAPPLVAQESGTTETLQAENGDEPLFDNQEALQLYQEGVKWYQKKNYAKAIEALDRAVEVNPEYKEAYYLLGYAYYKSGKMEQSREAFNQAYELDANYSPLPPSSGSK
jgi:tetratricopeptide (TPR) repeat protein